VAAALKLADQLTSSSRAIHESIVDVVTQLRMAVNALTVPRDADSKAQFLTNLNSIRLRAINVIGHYL
jgi:hypothetical protein